MRRFTWRWKKSPIWTSNTGARIVAEVFCAQLYKIPELKTSVKPKAPRLSSISVAVSDARAAKAAAEGLRIGAAIGSGLALSRDLANLPPNICTPTYLGTRAKSLAKDFPAVKPGYWTKARSKPSRWVRSLP